MASLIAELVSSLSNTAWPTKVRGVSLRLSTVRMRGQWLWYAHHKHIPLWVGRLFERHAFPAAVGYPRISGAWFGSPRLSPPQRNLEENESALVHRGSKEKAGCLSWCLHCMPSWKTVASRRTRVCPVTRAAPCALLRIMRCVYPPSPRAAIFSTPTR